MQQGSAPTTAPVPSAAAQALGTTGSRASAGLCQANTLRRRLARARDRVFLTGAGSRRRSRRFCLALVEKKNLAYMYGFNHWKNDR